MYNASTVILCIKSDLYRDLTFEAIHNEAISRVLAILEKNSEDAEVDKDGNRMFYLSEVVWHGSDVEQFVYMLSRRPDDYILCEDLWDDRSKDLTHGRWNDSPWNPGWDEECGISYVGIN